MKIPLGIYKQDILLDKLMSLVKVLARQSYSFSLSVPQIDVSRYLSRSPGWQQDCKRVAGFMQEYGLVYAFDPRVDHSRNQAFLNQMENYFERRSKQFDRGIRNIDVYEEEALPIGLKFASYEKLPPYLEERRKFAPPNEPFTPANPQYDPTWRYHWLLDKSDNLVPTDFPHFSDVMEGWGQKLRNTGMCIAEMIAIGLQLESNALSRTIEKGSLYLSPPGVDLSKTKPGDIITSFHRDFSLLTVHGKCRYSGLYAWLLTGQKFLVKLPEKHILVQGGKQLEWMTGGYLKAGFHEVVHNEVVEEQKQMNLKAGRNLWRVASTLFCHVQGDLSMRPFGRFRSAKVDEIYPDITADQYLLREHLESTPKH